MYSYLNNTLSLLIIFLNKGKIFCSSVPTINRIVFGIPNPSNQFNYLKKNRDGTHNFVKVKLSDEPDDMVIFKNKDSFELNLS